MDRNGQEWVGMDRNGQEWIGMDRSGQEWIGMDRSGQEWIGGGDMSMNACARKGNGWRGDETTLKNQRGKKGRLEKRRRMCHDYDVSSLVQLC